MMSMMSYGEKLYFAAPSKYHFVKYDKIKHFSRLPECLSERSHFLFIRVPKTFINKYESIFSSEIFWFTTRRVVESLGCH